jgi:hypothetical protein
MAVLTKKWLLQMASNSVKLSWMRLVSWEKGQQNRQGLGNGHTARATARHRTPPRMPVPDPQTASCRSR